ALEIGCGRGVGIGLILDLFGAQSVTAFDLDPKMVALAQQRLSRHGAVKTFVGSATEIQAEDKSYDAVFDFGILHHVPDWRTSLGEIHRVLKPGGRFYVEEIYGPFLTNYFVDQLLDHPEKGRFVHRQFADELRDAGFEIIAHQNISNLFGWHIADRPPFRGDG
ncbi:MAG: class I SAM-dependent methyltransferase, partial [Proteobacteria bacterium]|nr:class I SAM-dependent methyltransferase [Pseudomonadota bacterium]